MRLSPICPLTIHTRSQFSFVPFWLCVHPVENILTTDTARQMFWHPEEEDGSSSDCVPWLGQAGDKQGGEARWCPVSVERKYGKCVCGVRGNTAYTHTGQPATPCHTWVSQRLKSLQS